MQENNSEIFSLNDVKIGRLADLKIVIGKHLKSLISCNFNALKRLLLLRH